MIPNQKPIFLKNNIPILFFKSNFKGCAVWFSNSGDCIDDLFELKGLTHMLEHIYVTTTANDIYSNGITYASSVSFLGIDYNVNSKDHTNSTKNRINSKTNVFEYIPEWFFENGKVKDKISNHNIRDRINELDNETYLKALHYGDVLSVTESIRNNKYIIFSKFDSSKDDQTIKQKLYQLLDYLLQPKNIIIAFYNNRDNRNQYIDLYNQTFGSLVNKKISLKSNKILHPSINYKKGDVILINSLTDYRIDSVYLLPITKQSIILKKLDLLQEILSSKNGLVWNAQPIFSFDQDYNYFIELRVTHNNVFQQMNYLENLPHRLKKLKLELSNQIEKQSNAITNVNKVLSVDSKALSLESKLIDIEDIYIHQLEYTTGYYEEFDMNIPSDFITLFITNHAQYQNKLSINLIKTNNLKEIIPKVTSLIDIDNKFFIPDLQEKYYHDCNFNLLREVKLSEILSKNSNNNFLCLYFAPSYYNAIMANIIISIFPTSAFLLRNQLYLNQRNNYLMTLINQNQYLRLTDIPRHYYTNIILNLRTYSLLEPYIVYDNAIDLLTSNNRLLIETSIMPIYYTPFELSYNNDIFFYEYPFNYFIHLVKSKEQLSFNYIIRQLYKSTGIIYWGDICKYMSLQAVRGIMI